MIFAGNNDNGTQTANLLLVISGFQKDFDLLYSKHRRTRSKRLIFFIIKQPTPVYTIQSLYVAICGKMTCLADLFCSYVHLASFMWHYF